MLRHGGSGGTDARGRAGHAPFAPKTGRPSLDLASVNRKTEICRNWQQGRCVAEAWKCAFAHGTHELRRQSLDEMEYTGRIPNASKFRCYPCLTWITTGACPYFSRCVFIHDPRIRGPNAAYLYKHNSNRSHSGKSGGSVGSPLGRDIFYWPDMPRTDAGSNALPAISVNYDMDPSMLQSEDATERAVYQMWYSLVSTVTEIREQRNTLAGTGSASEASYDPSDSFSNAPPSREASFETRSDCDRTRPPPPPPQAPFPRNNRSCSSSSYWRTKSPDGRLPLFVRMSCTLSVSPAYVPLPTTTGLRHIWKDPCQVCEAADRPEISPEIVPPVTVPATVPRPLRARTGGGGGSVQHAPPSFPLADIDPRSSLSLEARTPARIMRKEQPSWRLSTGTGVENQRPKQQSTGPGGVVLGSPYPRRSTAPPALGRSRDTTTSAAAFNTARGLAEDFGMRTSHNTQGDNKLRQASDTRMKEGQRNASWEDVVRSALFEADEAASKPPQTKPSFSPTTSEPRAPGYHLPWYDGALPYGNPTVQSSVPPSYPSGGPVDSGHGDYPSPPSTGTSPKTPSLDFGTADDDSWSASSPQQTTYFSPCGAPGHPGTTTGAGTGPGTGATSSGYDPRNLSCHSDGGGIGGHGSGNYNNSGGGGSYVGQARRTTTYPFGSFAEGM